MSPIGRSGKKGDEQNHGHQCRPEWDSRSRYAATALACRTTVSRKRPSRRIVESQHAMQDACRAVSGCTWSSAHRNAEDSSATGSSIA